MENKMAANLERAFHYVRNNFDCEPCKTIAGCRCAEILAEMFDEAEHRGRLMIAPPMAMTRMVGSSPYMDTQIQPWEVWADWELNPWEANVVKRIKRWRRPGGKGVEDLRKAIHEMEYLLEQADG